MNDTKLFRLTYDDINDIMNSVHSVHIRDSRSECQVDEEMEKAASASARPEFYGLHRLDSLGTWIELSSRPKVNPEKEKRIMLKQQRQQRVKVHCSVLKMLKSCGVRERNRKDLSKISSINFQNSDMQRCEPLFCRNVVRVHIRLLLYTCNTCPGSARPRSNASLWSKQKLQG